MTTRPAPILGFIACLSFIPLAACASVDSEGYPSLAKRDVERVRGSAIPATPDSPPVSLPALSADDGQRVIQLRQQAESAHQRFTQGLGQTEARVNAGRGASSGSESWALATVALAHLDTIRNPATLALAELDTIYVRAEMDAVALDALVPARDAVLAMVSVQDAALARLKGQLPN